MILCVDIRIQLYTKFQILFVHEWGQMIIHECSQYIKDYIKHGSYHMLVGRSVDYPVDDKLKELKLYLIRGLMLNQTFS